MLSCIQYVNHILKLITMDGHWEMTFFICHQPVVEMFYNTLVTIYFGILLCDLLFWSLFHCLIAVKLITDLKNKIKGLVKLSTLLPVISRMHRTCVNRRQCTCTCSERSGTVAILAMNTERARLSQADKWEWRWHR